MMRAKDLTDVEPRPSPQDYLYLQTVEKGRIPSLAIPAYVLTKDGRNYKPMVKRRIYICSCFVNMGGLFLSDHDQYAYVYIDIVKSMHHLRQ